MKKLIRKWLGIEQPIPEEILHEMLNVRAEVNSLIPSKVIEEIKRAEDESVERSSKAWDRVQKINNNPISPEELLVFIFEQVLDQKQKDYDRWSAKTFYSNKGMFNMREFMKEVFLIDHNEIVVEEIVRKINELQIRKD